MNKVIRYEIHIAGENNPFYSFAGHYPIQVDEKILVKKEEKIYSVTVISISHEVNENQHIVRLNGTFNKLFSN